MIYEAKSIVVTSRTGNINRFDLRRNGVQLNPFVFLAPLAVLLRRGTFEAELITMVIILALIERYRKPGTHEDREDEMGSVLYSTCLGWERMGLARKEVEGSSGIV